MVGCTWSRLHWILPVALEALTLNFRCTENVVRFWEQVFRAGHLGSVDMIMRILTMIVISFIARCTEQIIWVGNVSYLSATEVLGSSPRHGIHCLRLLLFAFSACSHRFCSRSVNGHNANLHILCRTRSLTHLIIRRYPRIINCFIHVNLSSFRSSCLSIFSVLSFF
jgi:hypothetical protein